MCKGRRGSVADFLRRHSGNGTCEVDLLLYAVADDNRFLKVHRVLGHIDHEIVLRRLHGLPERRVAETCKLKVRRAFWKAYGERAIFIGHDSVGRRRHHGDAHKRLLPGIIDVSSDSPALRKCPQIAEEQRCSD